MLMMNDDVVVISNYILLIRSMVLPSRVVEI
jgi:hypothetical protein